MINVFKQQSFKSFRFRSTVTLLSLMLVVSLGLVSTVSYAGPPEEKKFLSRLVDAAMQRTRHNVRYDGAYMRLSYPNGDVPDDIGVCTDVVIRSYRTLGVDLQKAVHEDIKKHFNQYPSKRMWGLTRADKNIDHRRVPNLQAFFKRHGTTLPITQQAADYQPGDLVSWMLAGNLPHIGIVVDSKSADGTRPLVVHNIGAGPKMEDMLFDYKITGHYRYISAPNN